jgi:hypothetical protein
MITSRSFSSLSIAAALGLAVAAFPAHARDNDAANSEAGATVSAAQKADARGVKYCVVGKITGSRLPHKVCKTEKEWADSGYSLEDLRK